MDSANGFSMKSFIVAAIQMTSTARVVQNLTSAREFVAQAKEKGAYLVALPENFSFMGNEKEKLKVLEQLETEVKAFLSEISKEFEIFLLGGGYPTRSPSGISYNTASLYDPNGSEVFTYHKTHLFDHNVGDGRNYQESSFTESGKSPPPIYDTGLIHMSSAICYDIRFPELFRSLSLGGCELCFLPAAFTVPTGLAHWEVLLRARAIENLMYIVAPAQWGSHDPHGNRRTYGHSLIVSPWGEILSLLSEGEGVVSAEISRDVVMEKRAHFPVLKHRLFF